VKKRVYATAVRDGFVRNASVIKRRRRRVLGENKRYFTVNRVETFWHDERRPVLRGPVTECYARDASTSWNVWAIARVFISPTLHATSERKVYHCTAINWYASTCFRTISPRTYCRLNPFCRALNTTRPRGENKTPFKRVFIGFQANSSCNIRTVRD